MYAFKRRIITGGAVIALIAFAFTGPASAGTVPSGPAIPGGVNGPAGAAFRAPPSGAMTPAKRGLGQATSTIPYETNPNSPLIRPLHPATTLPTSPTASPRVAGPATKAPAVRPLLNTSCKGYAIFTFDDGPSTTTTQPLLDEMNALNIKGYFFVIGDKVSAGSQIVKNEVASGDVIGNHTWDHQSFTGASTGTAPLTDAQVTSEIGQTQSAVTALGLPAPTTYRPPYGDVNTEEDTLIRNTFGLQIVAPFALQSSTGGVIADSRDWTGVGTDQIVQNVTVGYTAASGRFYPGMQQSTPSQPAILAFHDTTGTTLYNALQPIVDWMNANGFCTTRTMRADATGGLVALPPTAEPASGLVVNPSVETDWPAGNAGSFPTTWPAGWMTAGWGTRTATFGTTTDAHTGAQAVTVSVSNWQSGDAKWVIVQRGSGTTSSNTYTPLAQPGHTYTFWAWTQGQWSGSAGIVAYYRDANNVWNYWTSGFAIPSSSGWNLISFTTAPLPAGATAVSFGVALSGNGTLTTDDYEMVAN